MFTRENVEEVMKSLREDVGGFGCEVHLQCSFILAVSKLYGDRFSCIPERRMKIGGEPCRIDLMIHDNKEKEDTYIEFKYKTNEVTLTLGNGLEVTTSKMSAQTYGRYQCWQDVERLEKIVNTGANAFFIFITNDSSYWTYWRKGRSNNSKVFSLEDRTVNHYTLKKYIDSKRNEKKKSVVTKEYKLEYSVFREYDGRRNSEFKQLILDIK